MSQSLAEGAFKAGDPAATSEVFTRNQRLGLIAIAVVAYGLTALIAGPIHFFAEPEFGASLALDRFASTAIIKAARTQSYEPPMFIDGVKWTMTVENSLGISGFKPFTWSASKKVFEEAGDVIDISGS